MQKKISNDKKQYLKSGLFEDYILFVIGVLRSAGMLEDFMSFIIWLHESNIDFFWIIIWVSYFCYGVAIADIWHNNCDNATIIELLIEENKLTENIIKKFLSGEIRFEDILEEILAEEVRLEDLLQEQQLYFDIIGFCVFVEWLFIINLLIIKLDLLLKNNEK